MKCVFKHKDYLMFALKWNKYAVARHNFKWVMGVKGLIPDSRKIVARPVSVKT